MFDFKNDYDDFIDDGDALFIDGNILCLLLSDNICDKDDINRIRLYRLLSLDALEDKNYYITNQYQLVNELKFIIINVAIILCIILI